MTDNSSFYMSQDYEVVPPMPGRAYPILCAEWDYLKAKIQQISHKHNIYHTVGSILIGASISTLISILIGAIDVGSPDSVSNRTIAWSCTIVLGFCGAVSLYFAREQSAVQRVQATDVIAQMEVIEKRYPSE